MEPMNVHSATAFAILFALWLVWRGSGPRRSRGLGGGCTLDLDSRVLGS
jgi:hypothetical protein